MANWGKLTSSSGNLYFSDPSLQLLDDRYQILKSTDHVGGYTNKFFNSTNTELLENNSLDGYEYYFVTQTDISYDFSDSSTKNYSDINIYGGNVRNNLFELEIINNIPNIDSNETNLNLYEILSNESGLISFFIDSSDNISYFDFLNNAFGDASYINNNLFNILGSVDLDNWMSGGLQTDKFGYLTEIGYTDSNSNRHKALISNFSTQSGASLLKSYTYTNNNEYIDYNLENAIEDSQGNVYYITRQNTNDYDYENNLKNSSEIHYLSVLNSNNNSINDIEFATHSYSQPFSGRRVGESSFDYFLWSDDNGDAWLVQEDSKDLAENPFYDGNNYGNTSMISHTKHFYKGWLLDKFNSIEQKADVETDFLENNLIEDKYEGSMFLDDNKQTGELILAVTSIEDQDISYFSSAFERFEVAINEANDFDPYRYLASNTHLIDVFGGNLDEASNHYYTFAEIENNTLMKFDEWSYLASYQDLISSLNGDSYEGVKHYVNYGYREGRATNIFDASNYLASNSDLMSLIGINNTDAAKHFSTNGFNEGRSLDSFDEWSYLASNHDLITGIDKTLADDHYVQNGFWESRSLDTFDEWSYLASNGDLIFAFGSSSVSATQHYVSNGYSEGRSIDTFDEWGYLASNHDLIAAFGSNTTEAIKHYISFGMLEGRSTSSFNAESYLSNYKDLNSVFGNDHLLAKRHFVEYGFSEGRFL